MGFFDRFRKSKSPSTDLEVTSPTGVMGDMAQIEPDKDEAEEKPVSKKGSFLGSLKSRFSKSAKNETPDPEKSSDQGPDQDNSNQDKLIELTLTDAGVLSWKGESFAVNMIWVVELEGTTAKEQIPFAQKMAQGRNMIDQNFEFCSDRKGADYYGFATKDLGHSVKMPILIDSLDPDYMGENWLAVLPISGQSGSYWLASKRDGVVFEDRVFTSQEKAAETFSDMLTAPNWGKIIAPEDWLIPDSLHGIPQRAVLAPKARRKLHILDPLKTYAPRIIFFGLLFLAAAGGGFYFFDRHQKHLAEMEELRLRVERAISLRPEDFPWFHRTSLPEFIEICETEILNTLVFVTGWENQQFTCKIERGRGSVSTGWNRSGGDAAWLRASMPEDFPEISLHPSINSATVTRNFTAPLDPEALRAEPWSRALIESRLAERFQFLGLDTNMRFVPDNRPADTNPLFNRHDLQIQGRMGFDQIIPMVADIPAIIPETLNFNLASETWSLVIRIHHPVILPEIAQ